jgi:hypothetical protein
VKGRHFQTFEIPKSHLPCSVPGEHDLPKQGTRMLEAGKTWLWGRDPEWTQEGEGLQRKRVQRLELQPGSIWAATLRADGERVMATEGRAKCSHTYGDDLMALSELPIKHSSLGCQALTSFKRRQIPPGQREFTTFPKRVSKSH